MTENRDSWRQYCNLVDTSEIGFNVLGLSEYPISRRCGERFEVSFSITSSDLMKEIKKRNLVDPVMPLNVMTEGFISQYIVADIKKEKLLASLNELQLSICTKFTEQLKIVSDRRSYFYIPKERIVQFVSVPVMYFDLMPGDISISFRVFTERYLGDMDDCESVVAKI